MRFPWMAVLLLLCGCTTAHPVDCATGLVAWDDCPAGSAGAKQRQSAEQADAKKCSSYGFTPGTSDFAQCRMIIDQNRDAAGRAFILGEIAKRN